jgi:hypothetical protein
MVLLINVKDNHMEPVHDHLIRLNGLRFYSFAAN